MGETRVGPEGQYGGCIHELIAIGRIVLDGLDDLRTQVEGETWPSHRGVAFCWKRDNGHANPGRIHARA